MNKQVLSLPISLIAVPPRLRELDPDWAALLAESFKDRGQDTPIRVTVAAGDHTHRLIAGLHRLQAAKLLGWERIDAIAFEGTDLEAEMMEIDENLIRRELSELDRATFLARRKEVWEALHPETKHGGDRRSDQVAKLGHLNQTTLESRFSAEAAKKLGLSERSIRRSVQRFEAIPADVRALIGSTRIATRGAELDALAKFTPAEQRRIVAELTDPQAPARSVREAAIRLELASDEPSNPRQQQYAALVNAWSKASDAGARRDYLEWLVSSAPPALRKVMQDAINRCAKPAGKDGAA